MHAHPCPLCFPTGYRENVLAVYVWDQRQPVIHLRRSMYSGWNERRCGWQERDYEQRREDVTTHSKG